MAMARAFLRIFILEASIHAGLSAVCFNCNSRADPKCDDTVDPARLPYMDCSSDYFKTVIDGATRGFTEVQDAFLAYPTVAYSESTCQKLVVQDDNGSVIFRTCSVWRLHGAETCDIHMKNLRSENVLFCEQCDYDLCNTSNVTSTNLFILFVGSFIAVTMMSLQ